MRIANAASPAAPLRDRRNYLLRQWLIFAAVLLLLLGLSIAAGYAAATGRSRITMLLMAPTAVAFGVWLFFKRFEFVTLLIPIAALMIPIELSTGTATNLPISWLMVAALLGIWLLTALVRKQVLLVPSALNMPYLVMSLICTISFFWGIVWRDPGLNSDGRFWLVQTAALITVLISFGAALLVGNFMRSEARLKYLLLVFIIIGGLMTIRQITNFTPHPFNDRGLWGTWTVLPAYALLIQPRVRWYWRIALLAVVAATLYQTMVVNADWLSGWVPTLVGMAVATFLRSWKAGLIVLMIGIVAVVLSLGFFEKVADDNINDGSLERISLWEQNWRVVREHWLFGTGPAGYAIYYMTYYRDDARSTHNNYLDILAQFGFTGTAAWLWIAVATTLEGYAAVRNAPHGWLKTVAIAATGGWLAAMVSMMFGDWVLPFAYNQGVGGYKYTVYTWLFAGAIIAVRHIQREAGVTQGAQV